MQYRKLRGTDLKLSVLGMGCSSFWALKSTPEETAISLLQHAYDKGINFFDTGSSYADGNAERRLGKFINSIERSSVVVSTKAGTKQASMGNATKDFSPKAIRESVAESLERLNTEYIDILFLHSPKLDELSSELFNEIEKLIDEGKIRFAGVHSSDKVVVDTVKSIDCFTVFLSDFNLTRASFETTINDIANLNKGFIAATPLAQMLFTNKIFFPTSKKDFWYLARALKNRRKQLINSFKLRFASQLPNIPAEAVALNFALDNKHVSSAIFGTTQHKNIDKNIEALTFSIPQEVFNKIRRIKLPFRE
ncbi:aldo/keto reductase [Thalassotalea sp. 1_MG-2023]|uniref:aldo/keto reductase n=1 Tax=Thalassotalea sp. 1_MG-2023 TaxID=3062680 RepID=UPI0026E3C25B|nr:aldo/keto reductase [Thalassotalea sp. 1_MG-2023]MDO6426515.1 aldo/keto reductase [Thalassotalea sp. 1_MG-2023]